MPKQKCLKTTDFKFRPTNNRKRKVKERGNVPLYQYFHSPSFRIVRIFASWMGFYVKVLALRIKHG